MPPLEQNTSRNRRGEQGPVPHRNGRLRCIGSSWFIARRGLTMHGPYASQDEAERALRERFPEA